MGLSNKLSCKVGSFSHHPNPHRFLRPEVFEAFFSHAGTLGCMICLTPQMFLPVYLHSNVGPYSMPAAALPTQVLQPPLCWESSLPQLPICTPPTRLDDCFFFNSLVVWLPYSSIFWQLWLFFSFKFVVILLLVV